jgi:hypothetical protein
VNAVCDVPTALAGFIIPLTVVIFTVAGGLKATFLASYLHTSISNTSPPPLAGTKGGGVCSLCVPGHLCLHCVQPTETKQK